LGDLVGLLAGLHQPGRRRVTQNVRGDLGAEASPRPGRLPRAALLQERETAVVNDAAVVTVRALPPARGTEQRAWTFGRWFALLGLDCAVGAAAQQACLKVDPAPVHRRQP